MAYTDSQVKTLHLILIPILILSLLGSLFIILNFTLLQNLRQNFAFKLVLMVSIGDFLFAFSKIFGLPSNNILCIIQALIIKIGELTSIFWILAIAFVIHYITTSKNVVISQKITKTWFKKLNIIIWCLVIILTILPLFTNSYGESGSWCWIKKDNVISQIWRYLTFYVPLWITILTIIILYVRVYNKMRIKSESKTEIEEKKSTFISRVKLYPIILISCWLFATIRRIYELATNNDAPYWLAIMHTCTTGLIGFCNGIVYGLTPEVRNADKEYIIEKCCKKNEQKNEKVPTTPGNSDAVIKNDVELESEMNEIR